MELEHKVRGLKRDLLRRALARLVEAGVHGLFTQGLDATDYLAALPLIPRGEIKVDPEFLELVSNGRTPGLGDDGNAGLG